MLDEAKFHAIRGAGGGGGGKGGGGSSRTPVEAPDDLFSDATAYILDVVSEGEIEGWADPDHPARCIFFDGTPLENDDGSINFEGVEYWLRTGTDAQETVPGFSDVEATATVGIKVEQAAPVPRTVTNPDADAVRVIVSIPQLTEQDLENGDLKGAEVSFAIETQVGAAAWQTQIEKTIDGKTTSGLERAYRLELPAERPVSVRVRRITEDSTSSALVDDIYFGSLTEIIDAKLSYPGTAYVALAIPATAFGGRLPVRTYRLRGMRCLVPSNYDPVARTYDAGIWDGTFVRAWTRNPAWFLYTALVEKRWGLGERIDASVVDKWQFYEIGQYCDELVDDGAGGQEPRFSIDGFLNSREAAQDVVGQLAAIFRGLTFWGAGAIVPVANRPADPVKLVTNANVENGAFSYAGTARSARHTAASAAFRDPEDHYALKRAVSWDVAELIARYGFRELELEMPFTASAGEALRACKWAVETDTTQRETVSYVAGLDHAAVRPGDAVLIADRHRSGFKVGGRLKAVEAARVQLDKAITIEAGVSYALMVATTTGGLVTIELASGQSGDLDWLDAAAPITESILAGAVFVLVSTSGAPRRFRVLGNRPDGLAKFAITAVEEDVDKWARVEQGLDLDTDPPYQLWLTGPLLPPAGLDCREQLYKNGSAIRSKIVVSVSPPNDPRTQIVEVQGDDPNDAAGWQSLGTDRRTVFEMLGTSVGAYKFRARMIDPLGRPSAWRTLNFDAAALLAPPEDVGAMASSVIGERLELSWPAVSDLDLSSYEVRFSAALSGATWSSATPIGSVAAPGTSIALPARSGTYLVKAVDLRGVPSTVASSIVVQVAEFDGFNVVEEVRGEPAWVGAHSDTVAVDGVLRLGGVQRLSQLPRMSEWLSLTFGTLGFVSSGSFEFDEVVDLTDVYTVRLSSGIVGLGENKLFRMSSWPKLSELVSLTGNDPDAWSAQFEVSISSSPAGEALSDWSDWQPLTLSELTGRGFRFRLVLSSFNAGVTPAISSAFVVVDMPDRNEGEPDNICPVGGLRVTHSPAFAVKPAVAVTLDDGQSGDRISVTNADATGFDLEVFDASDVSVERQFNYVAKGYGRRKS